MCMQMATRSHHQPQYRTGTDGYILVYNTMQSNEQAKALLCHAHNLKMKCEGYKFDFRLHSSITCNSIKSMDAHPLPTHSFTLIVPQACFMQGYSPPEVVITEFYSKAQPPPLPRVSFVTTALNNCLQVPLPCDCTRAQRDRFQYKGWDEGLKNNRASRGPSVRPSGPHRAYCGVVEVRVGWDPFEKEVSLGSEAGFTPSNSGAVRLPLQWGKGGRGATYPDP